MRFLLRIVYILMACAVNVHRADHVIKTTLGDVRGTAITVENAEVVGFLGLPYARPPTGDLRFQKPVEPTPWKDVLNATSVPPSCMQPENVFLSAGFQDESHHSEDCLYLNIWAPPPSIFKRPVLVWIHGGAFIMGSASHSYNNGSVMAARGDVVVVAMNYRLGAFGFFTADTEDAPGNLAFHDQLMALKWVHANIKNFGGDPQRVTLIGASAGAISANLHLLSPLSRGLFQRAVLQSGSLFSAGYLTDPQDAVRTSNEFAAAVDCSNDIDDDLLSKPSSVLRCLRSKTPEEILQAHVEFSTGTVISMRPMYGDEFMPKSHLHLIERGQFQNGEVLIGSNLDEGSLFLFLGFPHLYPLKSTRNVSREDTESVARILFHAFHSPVPTDVFDVYLDADSADSDKMRQNLIDLVGDLLFVCPAVHFADKYSSRGNKVYYYSFEHRTMDSIWGHWMGVPHSDEVQYILGMPIRMPKHYTNQELQFAKEIMDMWIAFAKTGNPSTKSIQWPPFQRSNGTYVSLKPGQYALGSELRLAQCQYWKRHLKYPQKDNAGHLAMQNFPGKVLWYFGNVLSSLNRFWTKVKSYSRKII
ncbi:unnamed protein product [Ixodes hexagonus]